MAPQYKVTYFELSGLAEGIRFLLSYGGLEFEDNRIAKDAWPTVKAAINPPAGQLPLLEFDGNVLFQSTAIARYLGDVIGIAGDTPLDNWKINAVIDTLNDFTQKLFLWFIEQNEAKKETIAAELLKETIPFYLSKFDFWVKENGGYVALKKLTWADLVFVAGVDFLDEIMTKLTNTPSVVTGYPNLEALRNTIRTIPSIKAWIDKRPPSRFY